MRPILEISLVGQLDASAARQRSRQIAALCGFGPNEQTRLSTVVSELVRGAIDKGAPGHIVFALTGTPGHQILVMTITLPPRETVAGLPGQPMQDDPSLPSAQILEASRRFMEKIDIDPASRTIVLHRACPAGSPYLEPDLIARALKKLAALPGEAALVAARQRNRELEASNQGFEARNDQLQLQADTLLSADRRKDEFLAILAHELRGPLSALAMAGEVLQKQAASPDRVLAVSQLVLRQTAHMSRLVEDLLDVSRIVRNEVLIENLPVDLREVVRIAVEQSAPAATRRMHEVATHMPDSPVMVQGDRTRLIQVLGNLIGNAIRYTPKGGVIGVRIEADAQGARVAVTDNGMGMTAELLPRLFDLFVQAQRSTDSRESGLGLGLALVKGLMAAHGGDVVAHSDGPGLGSRFEINFPRGAKA